MTENLHRHTDKHSCCFAHSPTQQSSSQSSFQQAKSRDICRSLRNSPSSSDRDQLTCQISRSSVELCLCLRVAKLRIEAMAAKMELAPLRQWDDFFPGTDRFAKPEFGDLAKWNNRVISNLMYYQTNYFVVALVVFLIVG